MNEKSLYKKLSCHTRGLAVSLPLQCEDLSLCTGTALCVAGLLASVPITFLSLWFLPSFSLPVPLTLSTSPVSLFKFMYFLRRN